VIRQVLMNINNKINKMNNTNKKYKAGMFSQIFWDQLPRLLLKVIETQMMIE